MTYLISDTRFGISAQLNLDRESLATALSKILKEKWIDHLIIFAEARFKDSFHQNLDGLTFLKHLLVDHKKDFYKIPVTLIHITPYEYLLNKEPDNLIIMAPNISRYRWKARWKNGLPNLPIKDCSEISFQGFKKYVLYSHKDEQFSEHDARNELGAKKLIQEWNCDFSHTELALHSKKQIFLERIKIYLFSATDKQTFIQQRKAVNKVLILEDEKEKWGPVFQLLLPHKYDLYSDYSEATDCLKDVKNKIKALFDGFNKDFYNQGYTENSIPQESSSYIKQLLSIWKYDMVICDLNFKTKTGEYEGVDLIKLIRSFDPYVPIIVFTASKKNESFQKLKEFQANISGVFVKGVDGLHKLTDFIWEHKLNYKLYNMQWRTKLNLHRFWNQENFYFFDYAKFDFSKIEEGKKLSIKIVLETLHDLLKPNNLKKPSFQDLMTLNVIEGENTSRLLQDVFCLFLISEIKLTYPNKMDYDELEKFHVYTSIFKTEQFFRGLRNKLYHVPGDNIEVTNKLGKSFYFYLMQYLDWLINPLQIEEVRKMLECKK